MKFKGYRRSDGRVGIRNKILILPASMCASDTTRMAAAQVEGAVTFDNQNGCSQVARDLKVTLDTITGLAANPNVYGTIVVSLGCEGAQLSMITKMIGEKTNKPLAGFVIQENGGTVKTIQKVVEAARRMAQEAAKLTREEFSVSELIVATNCGGSDITSGLAANPVIGYMSDRLVELGGTSVLCETSEFIGAEHILARRAKTPELGQRILKMVRDFEAGLVALGEDVRTGNPSPGNVRGGLTTLEEKSLGCIYKGGHSTINALYQNAQQLKTGEGLVIMDTVSNDAASVTALIAGGAQVVVFSTGRGTPLGNPIAPVIKITANQETYINMEDNIDLDVSPVIYGQRTLADMGEALLQELLDVANGKCVKAEALGFNEIAIGRLCNYV